MPLLCCVRTYNNGNRVVSWLNARQAEEWVSYNAVFRFGCALFVNGECRNLGYLGDERCNALAETYRQEVAEGRLVPPGQARTPSFSDTCRPAIGHGHSRRLG